MWPLVAFPNARASNNLPFEVSDRAIYPRHDFFSYVKQYRQVLVDWPIMTVHQYHGECLPTGASHFETGLDSVHGPWELGPPSTLEL